MKIEGEGQLLRIFISEDKQWEGKPLYEAILYLAKEQSIAGVTVLRGFMGFGAHSRIRTTKILRLSDDLPVVIEIVDKEEKINTLLPLLDTMVTEGMMTLERANIIVYRTPNHEDE